MICNASFNNLYRSQAKKIIELRSLDTCDWECFCDGPAFFTGLLYSSLDEAFNIIKKWKKRVL